MSDYFDLAKDLARQQMDGVNQVEQAIGEALNKAQRKLLDQAGVYMISLDDYVGDPAPAPSLSAGVAHTLLTLSARHAWQKHPRLNPAYECDESTRLDVGTAAHALLLENDSSKIVIVQADDWRTKVAREQRDEARSCGKQPILEKDMVQIRAMVKAAKIAIAGSELAEAYCDGISEQTLLWEEAGIWLRSRPDRASRDWRVEFDYKTAAGSAAPAIWGRGCMLQHGYDLQAALALRGTQKLRQPHDCVFIFIVQELEPPYAVSFVSLSPSWLALAEQKLTTAMSIWKGCLRTNEWPCYPSRVAYLEPPSYAVMGWDAMLPQIDAQDLI